MASAFCIFTLLRRNCLTRYILVDLILGSEEKLEHAILESGTAKGRLIHYHSLLEQITLSSLHENLHKGHKPNVRNHRFTYSVNFIFLLSFDADSILLMRNMDM